MDVTKLTGKKFLILLLYAPVNGSCDFPIVGRTRIMKMGFIFDKEIKSDFEKESNLTEISLFDDFMAWKYGPFSKKLLNDLEFLRNREFIKTKIASEAPIPEEYDEYEYWIEDYDDYEVDDYQQEEYCLTEKGLEKGEELWSILTPSQKNIMEEFKTLLARASLYKILEYVYKKYSKDGYTDKSLIRERFLA